MARRMEAGDCIRDVVEAAGDMDCGNGRAQLNKESTEETQKTCGGRRWRNPFVENSLGGSIVSNDDDLLVAESISPSEDSGYGDG